VSTVLKLPQLCWTCSEALQGELAVQLALFRTVACQWIVPSALQEIVTSGMYRLQMLHALGMGVRVAGTAVRVAVVVGGTLVRVSVGGTLVRVSVGGTLVRVSVGGTLVRVSVGGTLVRVSVGGTLVRVSVGGTLVRVSVGGTGVLVGVGVVQGAVRRQLPGGWPSPLPSLPRAPPLR
jgi:hypothetical protein